MRSKRWRRAVRVDYATRVMDADTMRARAARAHTRHPRFAAELLMLF